MKRFKCHQFICKWCMEVTRVPLSLDGSETREPVSWTEDDEDRWKCGLVLCPQSGGSAKPSRQFCLKAKMQDAATQGMIVTM